MKPNPDQLARLVAFVLERHRIWYRRTVLNQPKPWTTDKILQTYKFCNVFRELDTVTKWIDANIRQPYARHQHLWLMLCAARQINWPPTLQTLIAAPRAFFNSDEWSPKLMRLTMLAMRERGEKVYTGAYMISGQRSNPDRTKADKPHITANLTLKPMWDQRDTINGVLSRPGQTLQGAYDLLVEYNGFGSFMTAQVIADLKHTRYLRDAEDWWTWCALGPGSTRGLNRLYKRVRDPSAPHKGRFKPLGLRWDPEEALRALLPVQRALIKALKAEAKGKEGFLPYEPLCMQDVQNCLCEHDKRERVRLGEGRPRALYDGVRDARR